MLRVMSDRIGVVITDHLMPGCSGSELVRQIRDFNQWLPVIVLSGLAEAEAEYPGLRVVFRHKPIPPPDLIELVRASLDQASQQRGAA